MHEKQHTKASALSLAMTTLAFMADAMFEAEKAKMAQAKDAEDTKALQELEEILRAQQEQNERVSKIKKPHNSKHVPLDKIEDLEERKREEIWRAEEAKMSGAQIDESA